MKLNKYIDHTVLKADATIDDITQLCNEAKEYDFASVCINPTWVSTASKLLNDSNVLVCTVIGFPLGANTSATKAFETSDAIKNGAQEIDMVINIAALIHGDYDLVFNDIKAVVDAANGITVKVIIETCLLNDEQKIAACNIILKAGAQFVKTSTGFSTGGATKNDVELFKSIVKEDCLIKAAGGVRTLEDAKVMIEAGANRIGTSGGVYIVNGEESTTSY
ncbi:MAG: deoxyribose-phosphate aldolase [Mycoplasmatales bacterium]